MRFEILLHATIDELRRFCERLDENITVINISYYPEPPTVPIPRHKVRFVQISELALGNYPDWWGTADFDEKTLLALRPIEWKYFADAQRVNQTMFYNDGVPIDQLEYEHAFNPWHTHNHPRSLYDSQTEYIKDIARFSWLMRHEIERVTFLYPPHWNYGILIHALAELWHIPVTIYRHSLIPDHVIKMSGKWSLAQFSFDATMNSPVLNSPQAKNELRRLLSQEYKLPDYEIRNNKAAKSAKKPVGKIRRYLKNGIQWPSRILNPKYLYWKSNQNNSFRTRNKYFEQRAISKAQWPEKFILLCLHWQPEETSTRAGYFHNQYLVAKLLSDRLPESWKLLIKEHPQHFNRDSSSRSLTFYQNLNSLRRVNFVSNDSDMSELLEKSLGVASISGTILLEAVCKNKLAIAFGPSFTALHPYCLDASGDTITTEKIQRTFEAVDNAENNELHRNFIAFIESISTNREEIFKDDNSSD